MLAMERAELARLIDHTLLAPDATPGQIAMFCGEATELGVGTVCVSPNRLPLPGGAMAHVHVNWLSPTKIRQMVIGGSERPVWSQLSFRAAEDNFHQAARGGIGPALQLQGEQEVRELGLAVGRLGVVALFRVAGEDPAVAAAVGQGGDGRDARGLGLEQVRQEQRVLRHEGGPAAVRRRPRGTPARPAGVGEHRPVEDDPAAHGPQQPGGQRERRRLACAVGPEDGDDLPGTGGDLDVDVPVRRGGRDEEAAHAAGRPRTATTTISVWWIR